MLQVIGYVCIGQREIQYFSSTCHEHEIDEYILKAKEACYMSILHKQNNGRCWISVDIIKDDGTVKRV